MPDPAPTTPKRFPVWETIAIFLAIASLWPPYVLGWEGLPWRIVCWAMLGVMVAVLVRRLLAFERLQDEVRRKQAQGGEGEPKRARLPWEPPGDDA